MSNVRQRLIMALGVLGVLIALVVGVGAGGDNGGDYKVRAIFENAAFAIPGEDVMIAGAKVGAVDALEVTPDKRAAIVLKIDEAGFQDFRRDAECQVRLQSVIGEKLVECVPTQPRPEGDPPPPPLRKIPDGQDGAGQYLLPASNTVTPVGEDLIRSVMRRPYRERFAIILNEFGAGLAGRGKDLRTVIRKANPALRELDKVLAILARQNKLLAEGSSAGDRVLAEWAKERKAVANAIVKGNIAAQATAEKRVALERNFELFPKFIKELTPTMQALYEMTSEMTPVATNLNKTGTDVSRTIEALAPFSRAGIPAFTSLGQTADVGTQALEVAEPTIALLGDFTDDAVSLSTNLAKLLTSLRDENGIKNLMDLIYNVALSTNGYDQLGHYLRTTLLAGCNSLATVVNPACTANFIKGASGASVSKNAPKPRTALEKILAGEDPEKVLRGYQRQQRVEKRHEAQPQPAPKDEAKQPDSQAKPPESQAGLPQAPASDPDEAVLDYLLGAEKSTRRRGATAIASNPVLVGVATTLVIVVAVFLAYNANQGLPWVPSYRLQAEVPRASSLVKGNEVRIGGLRVGVVDKITPVQLDNGAVMAKLDLKLETRIKPLPVDSTIMIRPRSALGLKYIELTKGDSAQGFPEGGTLPLKNATPQPVEFDEFFNMWDKPTRVGNQQNLRGFGDAFAGRGADLNLALQELVPLVANAVPVLTNIASPETNFRRFFASQAQAAIITEPVAVQLGELWGNLSLTLAAFADVARPFLQDTITKGPSGQETFIEEAPTLRPFFRATGKFFAELQPGTDALVPRADEIANGFELGVKGLQGSPALNRRLDTFLGDLEDFAQDPIVPIGFKDLIQTVKALDPLLSHITPAQTVCNYMSLFFRNAASILSDGDSQGTWLRFMVITTPVAPDGGPAPNGEGGPSAAPANGGGRLITGFDPNYLHVNAYPNTAAPGQTRECEAGNETYARNKQAIGNVPGNQGTETDEQGKEQAP